MFSMKSAAAPAWKYCIWLHINTKIVDSVRSMFNIHSQPIGMLKVEENPINSIIDMWKFCRAIWNSKCIENYFRIYSMHWTCCDDHSTKKDSYRCIHNFRFSQYLDSYAVSDDFQLMLKSKTQIVHRIWNKILTS